MLVPTDAAPPGQPSAVYRCPFVSLVALLTWRDLLFRAKDLFVAAIGGSSTRHWWRTAGPTAGLRGSEHSRRRPRGRRPRQQRRQPAVGVSSGAAGSRAL